MKSELKRENVIQFQGGGLYTEHGQRIAAIALDGGVYMSDLCRGLTYFFPGCPFEQHEIMRRYLYNENCKWSCDSVNDFVNEFGVSALHELMHFGQ